MNREKINGYGAILRFITPILVALIIFILNGLRGDIHSVKNDLYELKAHFVNHLSGHKSMEVTLGERLSRIETILERR